MLDYIFSMPMIEFNFIDMEQNLLRKWIVKILQLVLGKNQIIIFFEVTAVFVYFDTVRNKFLLH